MSDYYAFCDRNGCIGFGDVVPDGTLSLYGVSAEWAGWLTDKVQVIATLSRTEDVSIVPNLAWVEDDAIALDLALCFHNEIDLHFRRDTEIMSKTKFGKTRGKIMRRRDELVDMASHGSEVA